MGREFEGDNGIGGGRLLRLYANYFDAQVSISEVDLVFGQNFPARAGAPAEPVVLTWLVTTPVHLVTLAEVVNSAITLYQGRYGAIPGSDPGAGRAG